MPPFFMPEPSTLKACRALCRGDLETLQDYVLRHLQGEVHLLATPDKGQAEVRLVFPEVTVPRVLALHNQRIRDADGGECGITLLPPG